MKIKNILFLVVILNVLLLFSCGECDAILNSMVMDREPSVNDQISFSIIQQNTDTIDIFYDSLVLSNDLKLFVLNDDNTSDSILFYLSLDSAQERMIIHPAYLFSKPYIGNIKIEFRFEIDSKEYYIPILFTQTINENDECNKRNTIISSIVIGSTNYTINSTNMVDYNGYNYIDNYITLIIPDASLKVHISK
ncbi:MAG: hypothetical protein DRI86_15955 [Bacteroidetes bacterium]|nr:MAG: hypothetical protein DRI86_15955 [Bacteroidota bacterium]